MRTTIVTAAVVVVVGSATAGLLVVAEQSVALREPTSKVAMRPATRAAMPPPSARSVSGASPAPTPPASPAGPAPSPTPQDEDPTPGPQPSPPANSPSSAATRLLQIQTLTADMTPKSVVASDSGVLFAQNMMYRHTISVFRADGEFLAAIPDAVRLADFGISGHPGTSRGAPVEMAFSPDGTTAWVSNYSMYGQGFGPEGSDSCSPDDGYDDSYLYRIDVATLDIVDVVEVGTVPKFVAVTPDGSKVLVTNWCSWDLSVVDTDSNEEVARVALEGSYPRGLVVAPDSTTAYVAMMGSDRIATVDLEAMVLTDAAWSRPGASPRHVVQSPDGNLLYVANNRSGTVAKVDRATGDVLEVVATGDLARSMTVAPDGDAVYVVNYGSDTMSKIRTSDMVVVQEVATDPKPIGITYEPTLRRVWVASYDGTLQVYDDTAQAGD